MLQRKLCHDTGLAFSKCLFRSEPELKSRPDFQFFQMFLRFYIQDSRIGKIHYGCPRVLVKLFYLHLAGS
jgi:hypothetical protein